MCCLCDQCAHRGGYRSCHNTASAKIMEKITVVVVFYVINVPNVEESSQVVILYCQCQEYRENIGVVYMINVPTIEAIGLV